MSEVEITKVDKGKQLSVRVRDSLVLRLEENPTTGYQWEIEELDNGMIELTSSSFDLKSDSAIGGGGIRIFRYDAKKPGDTRISLKLWRSWEGDSSIMERFQVMLKINLS